MKMTAIDRKINALLTAEGYAVIEATRNERTGSFKDLNINHITYLRGRRERIFVTTHKPVRATKG